MYLRLPAISCAWSFLATLSVCHIVVKESEPSLLHYLSSLKFAATVLQSGFGSTFWFGHCSQSVVELLLCLDSSSYCMTPALAVGQVAPQAFIQSRQVKTNQVTYCNWCSPISVLDYLTISLREFVFFFVCFFNIGKYLNHSTREMDKTDLINSH